MSVNEQLAEVIEATNRLTETVENHSDAINMSLNDAITSLNNAITDLENWKANASFLKRYVVSGFADAPRETWNLIKLFTTNNTVTEPFPWVHFGWHGPSSLGSGHFLPIMQTFPNSTGHHALFTKKGTGQIKFYLVRNTFFLAIKNAASNNANVGVQFGTYKAMSIESQGAVNLDEWVADQSASLINLIDFAV